MLSCGTGTALKRWCQSVRGLAMSDEPTASSLNNASLKLEMATGASRRTRLVRNRASRRTIDSSQPSAPAPAPGAAQVCLMPAAARRRTTTHASDALLAFVKQ